MFYSSLIVLFPSHEDIIPSLERGARFNTTFESDLTSHCGRNQQMYFNTPDEMRHVYENPQLTQEVCSGVCIGVCEASIYG